MIVEKQRVCLLIIFFNYAESEITFECLLSVGKNKS